MNFDGFSVFSKNFREENYLVFSISRYILFEEINAISIPEKKALSIRHIITPIYIRLIITVLHLLCIFSPEEKHKKLQVQQSSHSTKA
jgi:hypothetical protein